MTRLWLLGASVVTAGGGGMGGSAGCAGTETGNPSFAGKLGYDAYSSSPGVVALSAALREASEPELEVDNAWLVLGDVELLAGPECGTHDGAHVQGLGAGDHAAGQAPPTEFEGQAGAYCGVRLQLELGGERIPAEAPDSLHSESIVLQGRLADGRAYELHSRLQSSLTLHATQGEFVLDDTHAAVVIGFDLASWLGALSWQGASETSDGAVLVDADHNRALLEQFEAALPDGVALFRDRDGDGQLDAEHVQLAVAHD